MTNFHVLLLLLGCGYVHTSESNPVPTKTSFIARKPHKNHKKMKMEPPPPNSWAASGIAERVIAAGSVTGALYHAFMEPVLGKASILNTTSEAWRPLEFWGAGMVGSSNISGVAHDPLTDELEKEVNAETELRRNPILTKAHLSATPKVLSHASSSHFRSPGSVASDLKQAEFQLMAQLLRNATNFFAFEGSLVPVAVGFNNLHHIHVIEANAQTLKNLLEKPEVQDAIQDGRLVLTGPPAAEETVLSRDYAPACLPEQVQGAFEADWDLIYVGKECSPDNVGKILQAAPVDSRVAVLSLGTLNDHDVLDSYSNGGSAGSLSVLLRNAGPPATSPQAEDSGISLGDVVGSVVHGEGAWPH